VSDEDDAMRWLARLEVRLLVDDEESSG